jgi:hypothetical protein
MKNTIKNYFGAFLLITAMIFIVKAFLILWHFLAFIL